MKPPLKMPSSAVSGFGGSLALSSAHAGAAAVYPPGTVLAEAAVDLLEKLNARLGYAQA